MALFSDAPKVSPHQVTLNYQLIRNTTSPDEVATGVKSFVVNVRATELLKLGTGENLRSYIAEHNPKKRTRVHEAIRGTILNEPERFITRNSGFVIAASGIEVDDKKNTLTLQDASIINGAQSQGEIRLWHSEFGPDGQFDGESPQPFYARAEIIVDPDAAEVVETAIARNSATPVKSISQLGARGHLEDLEKSVAAMFPGVKVQKSETDFGDSFEDTRKILQYARLLMPDDVSLNDSAAEKLRAYKMAEQCLTDFSAWWEKRDQPDHPDFRKYWFTVQIAPFAMSEYRYWERHDGWNGQRIWEETRKGRACRREPKTNKIIWVSPGLIFPILGAMSAFVVEQDERWSIEKPDLFSPEEMIARAVAQFRSVGSDPMLMGRSASVYDALKIYPATIIQVMEAMKAVK